MKRAIVFEGNTIFTDNITFINRIKEDGTKFSFKVFFIGHDAPYLTFRYSSYETAKKKLWELNHLLGIHT